MKIVEKYLWRSVLFPLLFVIAALFTLWLTFDIFDKIGRLIDKGPPPWLLAQYFLVQLNEDDDICTLWGANRNYLRKVLNFATMCKKLHCDI